MLTYPNIDPVAISLWGFSIRWYSLAYIGGILGGWWYAERMNRRAKFMNAKQFDAILSWIVIGIVGGGRLGYVIFYNAPYFLHHPLEIFFLWQGGMSFHGGMTGTIISIYIFCRINKIEFFRVMDVAACVSPIGLGFGRLANFINGELYGRPGKSWTSMMFPTEIFSYDKLSAATTFSLVEKAKTLMPELQNYGLDKIKATLYEQYKAHNETVVRLFNDYFPQRYPSQLYEAGMEGLLFFIILSTLFWRYNKWQQPSFLSGAFLICYGIFRTIAECFREPDVQLGYFFQYVTMGQILCIPMLILGVYLIFRSRRRNVSATRRKKSVTA